MPPPTDTAISGLAALTNTNGGDLLVTVDVTDTSMSTNGTDKKATWAQVLAYIASSISGDVSVTNGGVSSVANVNAAILPTVGLNITSHFGTITSDTSNANTNCNAAVSDWHKFTLTANTTCYLLSATNGQQITVRAQQGNGTTFSFTMGQTITWFTGNYGAPGMPQNSNGAMTLTFKCTGTNTFDGFFCGASSA